MKVVNTTLQIGSYVLKSQSGTAGDKKLKVNTETGELLVGGLKFPYVPTNKLSFNPDGVMRFKDSELQVTVGNLWMTTNVVRLESFPNLNPGSQVMLSIEYGTQSAIISNAAKQSILLRYLPGTPVFITAVNYSTGAVGRSTLNPVPGGAYQIEAASTSTQTGALETFCVRYDYDYANAPTPADYKFIRSFSGWTINNILAATPALVREKYLQIYNDYMVGSNTSGYAFGLEISSYKRLMRTNNFINSPVYLYRYKDVNGNFTSQPMSERITEFSPLVPGVPFTVETGGYFSLLTYTGNDSMTEENFGNIVWANIQGGQLDDHLFFLEAGKEYVCFFSMMANGIGVNAVDPYPSGTGYAGDISMENNITFQCQVTGPLTKICTLQQTVDTRQTTYNVTLTVTPLN